MAQVLGVGGIFFKSRNPRKLASWYSRCLGVSLSFPAGAVFSAAAIPKESKIVWSVLPASTRYLDPSESQLMINFVVDDVDEALEQVIAAGGTRVGKPRGFPYGRFGWFLDPDGNKVELWQPGKPKQPQRRRKARGGRHRTSGSS